MNKTLLYTRYGHKSALLIFAFATLPYIALKLAGFDLPELPYMFLALLGLAKFYLSGAQTSKNIQERIKLSSKQGLSKQELVHHANIYKNAQDLALLGNGVLILLLSILL